MLNVLFLGDVVGAPGRDAIKKALPALRKKHDVHLCIANADNITHGIGSTRDKLEELLRYGVDFFTNGDHVFRFKNFGKDLDDKNFPAIRPANYPDQAPGRGYELVDLSSHGQVLIINLMGQVFMRDTLDSPFEKVEKILEQHADMTLAATVVDLHAEATSEKIALARYLDGRVSCIVGTHTHVPTADAMILPKGTAYVTDLGMVGVRDSILGENTEAVIDHYLNKTPHRYQLEESGDVLLCGVLVAIGKNGVAKKITRVDTVVSENVDK